MRSVIHWPAVQNVSGSRLVRRGRRAALQVGRTDRLEQPRAAVGHRQRAEIGRRGGIEEVEQTVLRHPRGRSPGTLVGERDEPGLGGDPLQPEPARRQLQAIDAAPPGVVGHMARQLPLGRRGQLEQRPGGERRHPLELRRGLAQHARRQDPAQHRAQQRIETPGIAHPGRVLEEASLVHRDEYTAVMSGFNSTLGLAVEGEGVVLDTRPEHEVVPGTIHFAVLATLAEVAAAAAVEAAVVPTAVHVQLLARAEPGRLVAHGRLLRRGRRLAFAEGEVKQGERLVAKGSITFALV